jgi:hypothetical protein
MKPSKKDYLTLIKRAESGNIDAAYKILEDIAWHFDRNLTIPIAYRYYFSKCVSEVDKNKPELDKAFNFKTSKQGRKLSHGDDIKLHIEVIEYLDVILNEKDISDDAAYRSAADKFGIDKKHVIGIYKKVDNNYVGVSKGQAWYETYYLMENIDLLRKMKMKGKN